MKISGSVFGVPFVRDNRRRGVLLCGITEPDGGKEPHYTVFTSPGDKVCLLN